MPKKKTDAARKRIPRAEPITLTVNGHDYELDVGGRPGEVEPCHTLSHTLRETLGLTGTKISCDEGACGTCAVSQLREGICAQDVNFRRIFPVLLSMPLLQAHVRRSKTDVALRPNTL